MNKQEINELRAKLLIEAADLLQPLNESITSENLTNIRIEVHEERHHMSIPYFKVFPKDKSKIARLHIFDGGREYHRDGIPSWKIKNTDLRDINAYVRSNYGSNPKYTVWNATCMSWNERNIGIQNMKIEKYMNGDYDEAYKNEPGYVPSNTPIPKWRVG